jgi:hypothetical protein
MDDRADEFGIEDGVFSELGIGSEDRNGNGWRNDNKHRHLGGSVNPALLCHGSPVLDVSTAGR